jgi:hypothetical protein
MELMRLSGWHGNADQEELFGLYKTWSRDPFMRAPREFLNLHFISAHKSEECFSIHTLTSP